MGSFSGHIDQTFFFLAIGVWWMLNMFPRHIRSQWTKREYEARLSYPLPWKPYVPIEAIVKTLCVIGAFIGEMWAARHGYFINDDGDFKHLVMMHHMSIFSAFIVHGIIDIMMSCGVPLPEGLDYLSLAGAFTWTAIAFKFHAHMDGKEPVETMVHVLPIYVLYAAALATLVQYWKPHNFMASISRLYCMLVLGTWFGHISFILYTPTPFPGSIPNPDWSRTDERNVHALVGLFGFHCNLHMFLIPVIYLCVYVFLKWRGEGRHEYQQLATSCGIED